MVRKLIAKHLGFPIQDYGRKTTIVNTIKQLKESQHWSAAQMQNYRLSKLKRLVNYAYENVPYYTELFNKNGITPNDIETLEDIKKIPILTKEMARLNQDKLVSKNLHNYKHIKKGKTGGTTGIPLVVYNDPNNRSVTWASYYRWYNWIGLEKEDRVVSLWGARTVTKMPFKTKAIIKTIDWIQNNKTINSFNISDDNLPRIYQEIMDFNPALIKGYLSAIILIAKYIQKNNLPINPNLKALSSTSETLLPMYRKLVEEVFNVPIYDQYGCGEVSAISYECKEHKGLHINEEHVYVESLNENNADVYNEKGRLIATSLDNYVMPFIRYENGDMTTLLSEKCTCGLNSPLMGNIDGRTIDTITLKNGAKVHGVFFTSLLMEVGITTDIISRFQIYQYETGAIDFKFETKNKIPYKLLESFKTEIYKFFKIVNITFVDFIPNEHTGKFKYLKSEIN